MTESCTTSITRMEGVGTLREICAAFRIETLASQIESLLDAREHFGVVDVAVLGQFRSGKTGRMSFPMRAFRKDVI